ncbi:hypothetical protein SEA_SIXAMA_23 [Gordonia phage Sixama]|uniref:Uncharacterized protein n=1 Tax=Gordonia phage Sixama TaxID=2653271 RepID=A0A5Q2F0C1_9CAUD|nr:hypothetical protein PP302_gp023 [Gordonia phage Sixama]QGF20202.1 hypothetical protein SEA_SIXAMA_23 [Gordonia phage Sixama]
MSAEEARRAREQVEAEIFEVSNQIYDLEMKRKKLINDFGTCGNWLDGHSYAKCTRLRGHLGGCGRYV